MTHREILIRSFSENRLFLVCAAAGFLIPLAVAFSYGAKISELAYIFPSIGMAFGFSLAMFALTVVALYPYVWWKNGRNWNETKSQVSRIMNDYASSERLVESVPVILGLLMMFFMISIVKSLILHINPYHLDPVMAALDFKIHGGNYPQYLVAPLIEKWSLVPIVNYSYNFWFGVMMGGCWFAAFIDRDKGRRNIFIWSSLSA
ncbi:MAG TPA: hypothetical protein PKH37_08490 [Alphaproteobacteria bacterium]|nr:hypothetical protein [Alphaproteobacteria bacterium]